MFDFIILAPLFALSFFILNGDPGVYWILSWLLMRWFENDAGVGIMPAVIRPYTGPAKGFGVAICSAIWGSYFAFGGFLKFSETLRF